MIHAITDLDMTRRFGVVIWGDTTGYGVFARRTFDQPAHMKILTRDIYNAFLTMKTDIDCFLKLMGDGFMAVKEYEDDPTPQQITEVLKAMAAMQNRCEEIVKSHRYPRPEGFRLGCAIGAVWRIETVMDRPDACSNPGCEISRMTDYVGYTVILGKRMIEMYRSVPLSCTQAIKEIAEETECGFEFEHLPPEQRSRGGVLEDDASTIWAFRRKAG